MNGDLDNLIRAARPKIDAGMRRRAFERAPVAVVPVAFTPWLRIAAALMLACTAGSLVSAWLVRSANTPQTDPEVAALQEQVDGLGKRADAVTGGRAVEDLKELNRRADEALKQAPVPLRQAVEAEIEHRAAQRRLEARQRHIEFVRKLYARQVDKAIADIRKDYHIDTAQEADLRKILTDHGEKARALVGRNYGCHSKAMPAVKEEFAKIQRGTESKVKTVLSGVPKALPGATLAEWGPNPDEDNWSDDESWQRWREEAQRSG